MTVSECGLHQAQVRCCKNRGGVYIKEVEKLGCRKVLLTSGFRVHYLIRASATELSGRVGAPWLLREAPWRREGGARGRLRLPELSERRNPPPPPVEGLGRCGVGGCCWEDPGRWG